MRITRVLTLAAVASLLMMQPHATPAMAQDDPAAQGGKSDSQPLPPPGLGPRKNAQGQAPAQQGQRQLPKVDNMGTFGKWNVQCAEVPAGADGGGGRSCGMTQQNKSEKNEKVAISVIVNKVKRGDKSSGNIAFQVPRTAQGITLTWKAPQARGGAVLGVVDIPAS